MKTYRKIFKAELNSELLNLMIQIMLDNVAGE